MLQVTGMTCSSCVSLIERKLRNTTGVNSAEVTLATSKAVIKFDPDRITKESIINVIKVCFITTSILIVN